MCVNVVESVSIYFYLVFELNDNTPKREIAWSADKKKRDTFNKALLAWLGY